ncbi:MAG: cation transporter, partial [Acetobacteraceae bacterium]
MDTIPPRPALQRLILPLAGLGCASCAGRVERAALAVPGVAAASVNLAAETAEIAFDPSRTDAAALASAIVAAGYGVPEERFALRVEGLSCASCSGRVERALAAVPGVLGASVNLATGAAEVRAVRGATGAAILAAAVERAGYGATAIDGAVPVPERRRDAVVLALCAALTLPFLLDMAVHAAGAHLLPGWLQFALALPVQVAGGARFYRGAWSALRAGAGTMDQLVALGTTAAFALSCWHLVAR